MDKLQNTSSVDVVASSKPGLVTDLNETYIGKDQYTYARNAVRNSKEGDLGTIGNEPSNLLCYSAPYKIIGQIDLPDDTNLIFSTDGVNSEIGLGNKKACTYKTLKNLSCLNFSLDHPIKGVAKSDFGKGIVVTFTDKFNPVRRIDLSKIDKLDCETSLLFKQINIPCLSLKKGQVGNIPNGMYSVAIAYNVDGQIFSDYFSVTNRIQLYSSTNSNSIEVRITDLDTEFDNFSLILIGSYVDPTTKGATKLAKVIGTYSTKTKVVEITDFINDDYSTVQLSDLVIKKNTWQKAGIISSNSNYLMLADLVGRTEENYQLKAMQIESEYVIKQVPANYYEEDGQEVGYYGDENYDFYIHGVYTSGEFTEKYHIPGRKIENNDTNLVSSADVYEYDTQFDDCEEPGKIVRWQVENTAGKMIPYNEEFKCGIRLLGRGKMGYYQSTEVYPDNEAMFGEDANTPIRFHKFPDECKVPRFQIINGKKYINIRAVRFKNIAKFDNPDIVGYQITRSDRKGGNGTVIARGLMTNMRGYMDEKEKEVMYSNYTVNDLNPDVYLSSTQTVYRAGKETNFTPLTEYYKDRFSFYSPHTLFEPRYSLGTEIKIESEEVAEVTGRFEIVHNHPKQKLLNQFSFWLAAAVGFIESALIILGKNSSIATHTSRRISLIHQGTLLQGTVGLPTGNVDNSIQEEFNIKTVGDLINLDISQYVLKYIKAGDITGFAKIRSLVVLIAALGIKIPYSIFGGIAQAEEIFNTIWNFTGYTDYVYQYNAHADFNKSICVQNGNKRRRLLRPALYIPSDKVSVDNKVINNQFREKTVYLELNKPISEPKTKDNSRGTISTFKICENKQSEITSVGSAFYVTSKVPNPNQYGRLGTARTVIMHSCVLPFDSEQEFTTSPVLFGGDCIIERFQFMKKMQFFTQTLANTNYPSDVEYDYRLYRNLAYPRFWMDSTKFDFSQILTKNVVNQAKFTRTTTSKHNLDCKKSKDGGSISRIDDAYMYTSNNCVMDFFVEADYNVGLREDSKTVPHYSKNKTSLSDIFRSDRLELHEEFLINRAFFDIYPTEIFLQQQREDFDPNNPLPIEQSNAVIYSLPSFNLQNIDNWQYFLPANYFSFKEADFGQLTGIHKMDQDRLIFLFSKSSPYVSMGRDFLTLEGSGRKVTIGDGGLFAQDPREVMPTDNNYGACTSPYAFANTHLGRYYPSSNQGRIINFAENSLDDITRQGMSYWCKNYMPIFLYKYFPEYPEVENPISGVGYLMAFDSFNETIYITKRDFSPKKEFIKDIKYENGKFNYKGRAITLRDSNYFNDISWTLSYSPMDKGFISWHDWHPDMVIQTENHFMTIKDNGVWKHNERYDNFCNFYNIDQPFEIEFLSSDGQQIHTVRSLEYILEVYKYKNFGRNRFHVLNENFDRLMVRNTEQISPLLNLYLGNPNPEENLRYPQKDPTNEVSYNITFHKEENKYRINQFWDSTKDRGEFSSAEIHLFPTDESGYKSVINPLAIDINKPEEQRKKFRHYLNKFRFSKTISGENKFLVKILDIKKQASIK